MRKGKGASQFPASFLTISVFMMLTNLLSSRFIFNLHGQEHVGFYTVIEIALSKVSFLWSLALSNGRSELISGFVFQVETIKAGQEHSGTSAFEDVRPVTGRSRFMATVQGSISYNHPS